MTPRTITYYEWFEDIQPELCKNLGIEDKYFREYHKVVYPDFDERFKKATHKPYYDCWHVWLSLFGDNASNDSFMANWFHLADEELTVEEYGEWTKPLIEAINKMILDYNLVDKETLIHYSW